MRHAATNDPKTVLVVDDSPENIHLLQGILRPSYRVKAATNGERALQIARKEPPPDLVILDVMMPGMDGHEVCRRLKNNPPTAAIPVIFVTGVLDDSERERGLSLGALAYLEKPIDSEGLLERVAELLQR